MSAVVRGTLTAVVGGVLTAEVGDSLSGAVVGALTAETLGGVEAAALSCPFLARSLLATNLVLTKSPPLATDGPWARAPMMLARSGAWTKVEIKVVQFQGFQNIGHAAPIGFHNICARL